jgi:ribonuclease HI
MKVVAFSDCSFSNEDNTSSYGIYLVPEIGAPWYTSSDTPKDIDDSFTGEMYGMYAALYHSICVFNADTIVLVCDSMGAGKKYNDWKKYHNGGKETVRKDHRIILLKQFWFLAENRSISFKWIEAHQSITTASLFGNANNFCDLLAKTHRMYSKMLDVDNLEFFG